MWKRFPCRLVSEMLAASCMLGTAGCTKDRDAYAESMELGNRYLKQEKYEKAEDQYLNALTIRPKEQAPARQLVQVYEATEQPDKKQRMERRLEQAEPVQAPIAADRQEEKVEKAPTVPPEEKAPSQEQPRKWSGRNSGFPKTRLCQPVLLA